MRTPAVLRHWRRRYYLQLKQAALRAYGTTCQCCGEDEERFLTIDHTRSDGARHRRANNIRAGMATYLWLKRNRYPRGFTVLCYNCNCGRHRNNGVCPHRD